MGTHRLQVQGDSKLIIKQVSDEFTMKEITAVSYPMVVQRLIKFFEDIWFKHMLRGHNRHVDTLATLASKIDDPREVIDVSIIKMTMPTTVAGLILAVVTDEEDWCVPLSGNSHSRLRLLSQQTRNISQY